MHNDDAGITLAPRSKDKDKGNCGVNVGIKDTNTYRKYVAERMIILKLNPNVVLKLS